MLNKMKKLNMVLNEMQRKAVEVKGKKNIVFSAPTGCGKTEAILLAITEGQSVNWFLPTITSCIFMYKRLKKDFNNLFTIEVATSVLSEKSYCTGLVNHGHIKIMTPDPVLLDFIKFNIDTGKFNRASEPVLVLDEIDNYPEDVRVVLKKYIDEANLRQVIVASATLDEGIKDTFKEYEKIEYLIPNTLKYKVGILGNSETSVGEGFKELIQKYHKKKRITVIANSISSFSKYQEVLDELNLSERDGVLIHHSNLSDDQRKENEQLLFENNYDILISNDIISFSVDIDTDILVTEMSDKLNVNIQRLGRLNRRNRKVDFTNLYICNPNFHWNPRFISDYRAEKIFRTYFRNFKMITSNRINEISKDIIIDVSSNDYEDIVEYVKRDILNDVPPKLREVPVTFKIPVLQKRRRKGKKEEEVIKTYSPLKWNTEEYGFPWDENPYSDEKCMEKNIVCIDGQKYIINDLRQLYSGTIILEEYNGETFSPWADKVEIEEVEFDKEEYLFKLFHRCSGFTPNLFDVNVSLKVFKEHKTTGERKDENIIIREFPIRTEVLLYGLYGKSELLDFSKLIKLSVIRTECDIYRDLETYYDKDHFEENSVGIQVLRNGLFDNLVEKIYKLAKETFNENNIHKTFLVCKEYLEDDITIESPCEYKEFTYLMNRNFLMEKYERLTVINKFLGGKDYEGYFFHKQPNFMNDLFDEEMRRYEELRDDFFSFCYKLKDSSMEDISELVNVKLEKMPIVLEELEEEVSFDNIAIEDINENITVKFYKDKDNVFDIQLSKPLYFYTKMKKDAKISLEDLIRMSIINKNILPQNRNSKELYLLNNKESFYQVIESLDKAMKEEYSNILTIKDFDTLENFIRSKHCLLEYMLFNTFNLFSFEDSVGFGVYEKGFLKSYSGTDFTKKFYEKGYITEENHMNKDAMIDYLLNGNDIRKRIDIEDLMIDAWYYWYHRKYDLTKNPYNYVFSEKNNDEKNSYVKIIDKVKHVVIPFYLDIYKNNELIIKDYKYEMDVPVFLGFLCYFKSDPINKEPLSAFLKLKRKCENGLKNTEFVNKFKNDILGPIPDMAFLNDYNKLSGIKGADLHKVVLYELRKHYNDLWDLLKEEGWFNTTLEGCLEICYRNMIYPIKDFIGYHDGERILDSLNVFEDLVSDKKDIFINHMKVSLGLPAFKYDLRNKPLENVEVYYYYGDIIRDMANTFTSAADKYNIKNYLPYIPSNEQWFYSEDTEEGEDDDDDYVE